LIKIKLLTRHEDLHARYLLTKKKLQINFNLLQAKKWNTNDNAIQRAQSKIKTEKQTVVKKKDSFKVLALTFWPICQGKLLAGMNHIVIRVFPTILLSKN